MKTPLLLVLSGIWAGCYRGTRLYVSSTLLDNHWIDDLLEMRTRRWTMLYRIGCKIRAVPMSDHLLLYLLGA